MNSGAWGVRGGRWHYLLVAYLTVMARTWAWPHLSNSGPITFRPGHRQHPQLQLMRPKWAVCLFKRV